MQCEVCGRSADRLMDVSIEGTKMRTCRECSKFGKVLDKRDERPPGRKPFLVAREKELDTVPDYGNIIRAAREAQGLTQKGLGARINEKISVIARLEAEKMSPSKTLAEKLEKALGIKILAYLEETKPSKPSSAVRELTLGDVVKIKKLKGS